MSSVYNARQEKDQTSSSHSQSKRAEGPGLVLSSTSHKLIFKPSQEYRHNRLRRRILTTASLIENAFQQSNFRYRVAFITLTYAPDQKWHKNDISLLNNHYRNWGKRRGIKITGVWVLEYTQQGRPHYHLVLFLPRGISPPLPDKQGWWVKGSTHAKWARKPVAYLAKYVSKYPTNAPCIPGARSYGCVGLSLAIRAKVSWYMAPKWLRERVFDPQGNPYFDLDKPLVKRGSWWCDLIHNVSYRSPWVLDGFSDGAIDLTYIGWTSDDIRFSV